MADLHAELRTRIAVDEIHNPAPFFRLLQSTTAGAATAFYAGEPSVKQLYLSASPLGQPQQCTTTAALGWDYPLLAGPLRTFDMTRFPAPFTIRP